MMRDAIYAICILICIGISSTAWRELADMAGKPQEQRTATAMIGVISAWLTLLLIGQWL